jgi:hypothetical protein
MQCRKKSSPVALTANIPQFGESCSTLGMNGLSTYDLLHRTL